MDTSNKGLWIGVVVVVVIIGFFVWKKMSAKPADGTPAAGQPKKSLSRSDEMEKELNGGDIIVYFPS